jgi:hypothetical protein
MEGLPFKKMLLYVLPLSALMALFSVAWCVDYHKEQLAQLAERKD